MLYLRDVIETCDGPAARSMVVALLNGGSAALIDLDDPFAWPVIRDVQELVDAVERGAVRLGDPVVPAASARTSLSDKEVKARNDRWEVIKPLVESVQDIFDPAQRGRLVRGAEREGASAKSIMRWLRSYWQGGLTPMALVGDWNRCGALGQPREGDYKKLGRPRQAGSKPGINMNRAMRRVARSVLWSWWRRNSKATITNAYLEFCNRIFYVEEHVAGRVRSKEDLRPEFKRTGIVTEEQFRAFKARWVDSLGLARARKGPKKWDATSRGLPSTVTVDAVGPGSRYVIDATILDVYIRSRVNPERIVGRAVLYVVRDAWSRLIVGVYVGVGNASWACAMMALANVIEDKVAFCRRYGVEIEPHEWPKSELSERLLTDGEMLHEHADRLALHLNVKVETASSWRGDLKGLLENVFGILRTEFAAYTPGWIEPDFRERGARDYRLDAVFDADDVMRQVILAVIRRNNDAPLAKYDREPGMPSEKVAPFPVDLWNWGIANRTGRQIRLPADHVVFRIMPEAKATVDEHGLRFIDTWYLSDGMLDRNWLAKGRAKPFEVTISFDPMSARRVYLHLDGAPLGFEVCELSPRSRAYGEGVDATFWDVGLENLDRKAVLADGREREVASRLETTAGTRRIVAAAQERLPHGGTGSAAAQTVGIRGNRAAEMVLQKALDGAQLQLGPPSPAGSDAAPALMLAPPGGSSGQGPPAHQDERQDEVEPDLDFSIDDL